MKEFLMSYKDNYRSIQVNLLKDKHKQIIEWLDQKCDEQERSLNSFILQLIKEEYNRDVKEKDRNNI